MHPAHHTSCAVKPGLSRLFGALLFWLAAQVQAEPPAVPAAVDQRIRAFNSHQLETYLAAHSKDVAIFEFPDERIGTGRAHLKKIFGPQLEQKLGSIVVEHQVVIGERVVSQELVDFGFGEPERLVAIYTVEGGEITTIHLVEKD